MKKSSKTVLFLGVVFFIGIVRPPSPATQEVRYMPQVWIGGEYNDNIFFDRNNEVSDFIYNINPSVKIDYRTERLNVDSVATLKLRRYLSETSMDREDQYYNFHAKYRLSERWSLKGRLKYQKDVTLESKTIDIDEIDETEIIVPGDNIEPGIERFLSGRKRFDAITSFNYRLTELSNWGFSYRYFKTKYNFEDNTDYEYRNIGTTFMRQMEGQRDRIGANLAFGQNISEVNESDTYRLTFIWNHLFSKLLNFHTRIGARYTKQKSTITGDTKTNWNGVADIRLQKFGDNYEANFGFKQNLRTASDGSSVNVSRLFGNSEIELSERLKFRLEGDLYLTREDGNSTFDEESVYFEMIPSIEYLLTENHSISLAYSYTMDYDTVNNNDRDKQRNRIWFVIGFRFPKEL